MSATLQAVAQRAAARSIAERWRQLVTLLNLHLAGVILLGLLNLYLILHMVYAYQQVHSQNDDAVARQTILLKSAELGAMPLRGLDGKIAHASDEAEAFYALRFPSAYSELLAELGADAKREHVRLAGVQYAQAAVPNEGSGELTEVKMDARLSGEYRPLVLFLNALERDRMFFLITNVALTGQQSGTVNLRLRLTTYLRARQPGEAVVPLIDASPSDAAADASSPDAPNAAKASR